MLLYEQKLLKAIKKLLKAINQTNSARTNTQGLKITESRVDAVVGELAFHQRGLGSIP